MLGSMYWTSEQLIVVSWQIMVDGGFTSANSVLKLPEFYMYIFMIKSI